MNIFRRTFLRLFPRDPASDNRAGIGPFKFTGRFFWFLRYPASIHDAGDNRINAGETEMSHSSGDDKFLESVKNEAWLNAENNAQKRIALIVGGIARSLMRALRFGRGEK